MPASDWVKKEYTRSDGFTDNKAALILSNVRQFVDSSCNMTNDEFRSMLDSGKCILYEYKKSQHSVYIALLDKTMTSSQMWRLAYFSYDSRNVPADGVIGVIVRCIVEFMQEQYLGKVKNLRGRSRGLYYYTPLATLENKVFLSRVLTQVTDILNDTNYKNYVSLSQRVEGQFVRWELTYKGTGE